MSNLSELIGGPSKLSKEDKDMLLEYLGINTDLPSLGPPGLCSAYQKFKAVISATPKVMGLAKDSEWKAQFSDTSMGSHHCPLHWYFYGQNPVLPVLEANVFTSTGIPRYEGLVESAQRSAFNCGVRMSYTLSHFLTWNNGWRRRIGRLISSNTMGRVRGRLHRVHLSWRKRSKMREIEQWCRGNTRSPRFQGNLMGSLSK